MMLKRWASRGLLIFVTPLSALTVILCGCTDRAEVRTANRESHAQSPAVTARPQPLDAALEHFNQNRYRAAISACDAVIAADPQDAQAYLLRGVTYCVCDDIEQGIADVDQALRLNPAYLHADATVAAPDRALAYYQTAVRNLDTTSILKPRYADAFAARGLVYHREGDPAGAIRCSTEAIRLNPQLARAHLCRGRARLMTGDAEAADDDFRRAVKLQPSLAPAVAETRERNRVAAEAAEPS